MQAGMHEAPPQIQPQRLGDYLDVMSKSVFQSGISWRVVESKWEGTRAAFADFDAQKVAAFQPDDLDRLQADTASFATAARSRPPFTTPRPCSTWSASTAASRAT